MNFIKKIILFSLIVSFYQIQSAGKHADKNKKDKESKKTLNAAYLEIFNIIKKDPKFSLWQSISTLSWVDNTENLIKTLRNKLNEAKKLTKFNINTIYSGETMLTWSVKC